MNRRMIVYVLCMIMRVLAIAMVPALIIALWTGERASAYGFILTIGILLLASMITRFLRPKNYNFYAREGFLVVAIAWIMVSALGALPFLFSGAIPNYIDCLFETVSGFTTTGSSILTNVEMMPKSLLYWRSFTVWLGGMGVLVFLMAIIPLTKNSGHSMHILRAESPGPQVDKLVPRIKDSAKILYSIYIGMTILQIILLIAGGMPAFDSVTTSFCTAGTGGFAVLNDSMASYTPYMQNIITIFMMLFGVNFNVYYLLLIREFGRAIKNEELWLYIGIFAAAVITITINIAAMFQTVMQSMHHAAFQVASIMTTTGFSSINFDLWPEYSRIIMVVLMVFGGCAGSTAGGIKMSRVLLLGKSFVRDLRRKLRPQAVEVVKLDGHVVEEETIRASQSYLVAYVFIAIISIVLVAINGFSTETTVTAVATCLNNVGPGLDMIGPAGNFSVFSGLSKLVLSANMLIGRLEIFPMLMLFTPSAWRR